MSRTTNDTIVCPCLNVTEKQVLEEIQNGARTIQDLKSTLHVASRCSGCEAFLYDIVDKKINPDSPSIRPTSKHRSFKDTLRVIYHRIRPPWLKMASIYVEQPNLHTRLNLANLTLPESTQSNKPVKLQLDLFDPGGKILTTESYLVGSNCTRSIEIGELLKKAGLSSSFGLLKARVQSDQLGSKRYYCHWYNDGSLTSTHEKALDKGLAHGYQTLSKVLLTESYETYLSVTNYTDRPYHSNIFLLNADNKLIQTEIDLPPWGSFFGSIAQLIPESHDHLNQRNGVLYFDNSAQPGIFYYFGHNKVKNTWLVQHL